MCHQVCNPPGQDWQSLSQFLVSPSLAETLRPMAEVRGWGMTRMNLTLTDFPTACDRGTCQGSRFRGGKVKAPWEPWGGARTFAPSVDGRPLDMEHVPGLGSTASEALIRLGARRGWLCLSVAWPGAKRDRSVSHPGPPLEASRECWEIHAEREGRSAVRAAVVIALVSMEKALFPILPAKTSTSFLTEATSEILAVSGYG